MRKDRIRARLKASGQTITDIIIQRNMAVTLYAVAIATVKANRKAEQIFVNYEKFMMKVEERAEEFFIDHRERWTSLDRIPRMQEMIRRVRTGRK